MRALAILMLLGLGTAHAEVNYFCDGCYWWRYKAHGYLNESNLPYDGSYETDYAHHFSYGYRPVINRQPVDTLVLFFGGVPSRTEGYEAFYINAVNRGYFVMSLDYINDHGLTELCTSNRDCAGLYAEQTVMGVDHGFFARYFGSSGLTPGKAFNNSIVNRFGHWLKWLIDTDAAGAAQWRQFCSAFDANDICTQPKWSKIIVASHSNGGSLAWWIVKNLGAKKAILLSAPSARMNTANVTPASWEYTPFWLLNPDPSDDHYSMYDNPGTAAGKVRAFLNFHDSRYKPGDTDPSQHPSDNPNWVANEGKNQPGNLVDIGVAEHQMASTGMCNTMAWGPWITVRDSVVPTGGQAHESTAADGASLWSSGFRTCVWNYLLDQ